MILHKFTISFDIAYISIFFLIFVNLNAMKERIILFIILDIYFLTKLYIYHSVNN